MLLDAVGCNAELVCHFLIRQSLYHEAQHLYLRFGKFGALDVADLHFRRFVGIDRLAAHGELNDVHQLFLAYVLEIYAVRADFPRAVQISRVKHGGDDDDFDLDGIDDEDIDEVEDTDEVEYTEDTDIENTVDSDDSTDSDDIDITTDTDIPNNDITADIDIKENKEENKEENKMPTYNTYILNKDTGTFLSIEKASKMDILKKIVELNTTNVMVLIEVNDKWQELEILE